MNRSVVGTPNKSLGAFTGPTASVGKIASAVKAQKPVTSQPAKPMEAFNATPAVPNNIIKAKSTPASTNPALKMKNGWGS